LSDQLGAPVRIGINVSPQQLRDPGLVGLFARVLDDHGLAAQQVSIEITESALLAADAVTTETVRALDAMGARIVLDDFGTGYFSVATLKNHPVKTLKIDRSFVEGLPDDRDNLAIVTALIGMGHGLGLEVVAEGVDSRAEFDALRGLDCDYAQGFLLGAPAPLRAAAPPAAA
jgi:EAL domain-containing protein (putative c-di-GMP-specific phosphodiesterase class I)